MTSLEYVKNVESATYSFELIVSPTYNYQCVIIPRHFVIKSNKQPNWLNRFFQRVCLGWKWEKINAK